MYELKAKPENMHALQLLYDHSGYATGIIHHIKHHILPLLAQKNIFIDIGPGPGIITRAISKFFQRTIVVEPLPDFQAYYQSLGMTVIRAPYSSQSAGLSAEFILAAHMLYHLPRAEWGMIIKQMVQQLKPGGILMIVLSAPRGSWHDLCLQLNPDYPHAGYLLECLEKLDLPFTTQESTVIYTTQSSDEMAEICRYVLDKDCILHQPSFEFNEEESTALETLITNFSQSLETMRHNYHLRQEDDWFFLQKPH